MKKKKNCLFCRVKTKVVAENKLAYVTFDSYPVSNYHSLIIPKRHIKSYFNLTELEVISCKKLIIIMKNKIKKKDNLVKGFNIGINEGKVAGQSIMHSHIHLIPRRKGDVLNPQGGVRGVIPSKQHYIKKLK